jgi:hypothetical protein
VAEASAMESDIIRVYKFLPRQYGIQALQRRSLKLSELNKLNDPFELMSYRGADGQTFRDTMDGAVLYFGVLCFCRHYNNLLLWSHYADSHRGMCLGFDVRCKPANRGNPMLFSGIGFGVPVKYTQDRCDVPPDQGDRIAERIDQIDEALYTKSEHWAYEQEVRMLMYLKAKLGNHYFADFDHRLILKEVILGAENCDSREVIRRCLHDEDKDVEIVKLKLSHVAYEVIRDESFA